MTTPQPIVTSDPLDSEQDASDRLRAVDALTADFKAQHPLWNLLTCRMEANMLYNKWFVACHRDALAVASKRADDQCHT